MAKWKKLNPETGEYEEIANSGSSNNGGIVSKDTIGVEDAYTTYQIPDIATSSSAVYWGTTYILNNLLAGDVITTRRQHNGQGNIISGDGTDLTSQIVWTNFIDGILTLTQDYAEVLVSCVTDYEYMATVSKRTADMMNRPAVNGEFIPTISDNEKSTLKVLSSDKIRTDYGMDIQKAKEALSGGVWIALGDSYTKYAEGYFRALADKYGMIYDDQGKVSSTICGDTTGNKGFSPFWSRLDNFITNYTGDGQTIDGVVYTAEDVKLITFMGGANDGSGTDTWLGAPFSKDTMYIYGSCNYMFTKLVETFPNAQIIVILQPANYNQSVANITTDEDAVKVGFTNLAEIQNYSDYEYSQHVMCRKEKAIKECAERLGLHIVDCIFSWYNVVNPTHRAKYWNADKIHLSGDGSAALADKLDKEGILSVFGK